MTTICAVSGRGPDQILAGSAQPSYRTVRRPSRGGGPTWRSSGPPFWPAARRSTAPPVLIVA